jgi:prephenate dehydrogenase
MNHSLGDILESSIVENQAGQECTFFPTATVVIIGLGLMGGSLAMALRGRCAHLFGVDSDPRVVRRALENQIVESASTDPGALLSEADLIVIAVPVRASLGILQRLPEYHPGSALVIDLGSTKGKVIQAMAALPERFDPLGGHPMCGKENGTLANAEAGLFKEAPFALLPLARTTPHLRQVAMELVDLLGACPLWLDAEQHDQWVAFTSHLPHLLATALVLSTPTACAPLAGPGFRSSSRLAAGSADMRVDIYATNSAAVLEALDCYRQQLDILERLLQQGDWDNLRDLLALGAERRQSFLGGCR